MAWANGSCRSRLIGALLALFLAGPLIAEAQSKRDGITFEEYRRSFPPAPIAVRAELRGGKATVIWARPPVAAPSEKLAYDPEVDRYRVYRVTRDREMVLIGETRATLFTDIGARAGTTQRYAVTVVQRSGHESAPSVEAVLRIPR